MPIRHNLLLLPELPVSTTHLLMSALRSTGRCRHVLPPLLICNGLRVGWYASRTPLPAFLLPCHYTCLLLTRRRCLDRRALQTSCPRPNARSRRQAEGLPRDHGLIYEIERRHIKVRFLFRAREHIPACLDMRAPSVHHMLHAEDLRARTHARTASHLIALLCAVDPSRFPRTSQGNTPRDF